MADSLITFAIIALAAGYLLSRRLRNKKGPSDCGCGGGCQGCANNPDGLSGINECGSRLPAQSMERDLR